MSEQWLTFREAVEIIRGRLGASIGRSEAVTHAARASGEVRFNNPADPVLLLADDGLVGMSLRPGRHSNRRMTAEDMFQISSEDLLDWLDRQAPAEAERSKARAQTRRTRARDAIQALWPNEIIPEQALLSNVRLCKKVGDWLKEDCQRQSVPADIPSDDTILRAAGRK